MGFNKNLGIVNVPVNNTLIVTDLVAPNISKNFVVQVSSINSNGLIVFNAKFTSALRCSWQIADSSAAPATGSAIAGCTDTQWCGSNFQVGTSVSNIFQTALSVPNNNTPVTPVTPTNTTTTSAGFNVFSYAILLILALLI